LRHIPSGRTPWQSISNFGLQQYMRHTADTDAVFPHAYTFSNGFLLPGYKPGLGVDIDEQLAAHGSISSFGSSNTSPSIRP
jgi:L-alanine-DL-glutamate epimerase-like enolase superfamily enzyme